MSGCVCSLRMLRCVLAGGFIVLGLASGFAQQKNFPFDSELFLDARPMAGSKRIPNIDIAAGGSIAIELWCNRVEGQVVVAGDTLTLVLGQPTERACSPDQAQRDAELLAALNGVTNWRTEGDALLLVGPQTLRFLPPTH